MTGFAGNVQIIVIL